MSGGRHYLRVLGLGCLLLGSPVCIPGRSQAAAPGATLFATPRIHEVAIQISPEGIEGLGKNPREFVSADVFDSGTNYSRVGIHLKGSVGSFRPVNGKPGLTLDFSRFEKDQKFHGLRRIHLNNSVEDPSLLDEKLASELFEAAGVPAPRVTWARVTLNGRRLGLYVLKEGFTEDFLSRHFRQVGADLYQPKDGHDVDRELDRLSIRAPRLEANLVKPLAEAAREPNPGSRWQLLAPVVDMNRFIPFMAMEVLLGHRDGYCLARNNFRVYCDADTHKVVFFPHGMDQLFGTADLPWQPSTAGLVAQALLASPEGRQRYEACFRSLFTNVFDLQGMTNRVGELNAQLRPFLSSGEAAVLAREAASLKERIVQRHASLKGQLAAPPLTPLVFQKGAAPLGDSAAWSPMDDHAGVTLNRVPAPDGVPALHIGLKAEAAASWRTKRLLARGRYRFEGLARSDGFQPLGFGKHQGLALRVAGAARAEQEESAEGSWKKFRADFDVTQERELVEFVCELRAIAGNAWFDLGSLQVRQILSE